MKEVDKMDEVDSSINYRQTGKLLTGKLHTGSITQTASQATNKLAQIGVLKRTRKTSPAIPSKFETILFNKKKEIKGFTRGSPRFEKPVIKEAPGPGHYTAYSPSSFVRYSGESYSKHGMGGFASKAKRIPEKKPNYYPGPGTYVGPPQVQVAGTRGGARSSFASTSSRIRKQYINDTIGPGHYDQPGRAINAPQRVYLYRNPAMCKRAHSDDLSSAMSPSAAGESSGPSPSRRMREMKVPRAAFGGGGGRFRKKKINQTPGPYKYDMPSNVSNAASSSFKSNEQRNFMNKLVEGPGPDKYQGHNTWRTNGKASGVFVKRGVDRFGRVIEPKSKRTPKSFFPGPGHYETAKVNIGKQPQQYLSLIHI